MPLTPLDRRMWAVPVIQKKHKESTIQAPIRSILSCRVCEGFSVKSIGLVTGNKGLVISFCQLLYFHKQPHSIVNADVISRRVGMMAK